MPIIWNRETEPADPDDPRFDSVREQLAEVLPDGERTERARVATGLDPVLDADGLPAAVGTVRALMLTGTVVVPPTGRHHDDEPGQTTTHENEEDDR